MLSQIDQTYNTFSQNFGSMSFGLSLATMQFPNLHSTVVLNQKQFK
jgi:hypothetical protein